MEISFSISHIEKKVVLIYRLKYGKGKIYLIDFIMDYIRKQKWEDINLELFAKVL